MDLQIPDLEYNHTFTATLKSGDVVNGKGNIEFREILDKYELKNIKHFIVRHIDTNQEMSVDLDTGSFVFGDNKSPLVVDLGLTTKDESGNRVKLKETEMEKDLIYFRRVRHDFKPDGTIESEQKPCIGWKTKVDGKVYQKLLFLNSDGSFTLSDRK